jgi:hypothetical protein
MRGCAWHEAIMVIRPARDGTGQKVQDGHLLAAQLHAGVKCLSCILAGWALAISLPGWFFVGDVHEEFW